MKNLISHVEFLILEHEYVIIPEFGSFFLKRESAHIDERGNVLPPALNLKFSSEVKDNDRLLVESYMQRFSIPYDVAYSQIESAVKRMNSQLSSKYKVEFGRLGRLVYTRKGEIRFEPASVNFTRHPQVWGYSRVDMRPLAEEWELNKSARWAKIIKYAGGVFAAFILILLLLFLGQKIFFSSNASTGMGFPFVEKDLHPHISLNKIHEIFEKRKAPIQGLLEPHSNQSENHQVPRIIVRY